MHCWKLSSRAGALLFVILALAGCTGARTFAPTPVRPAPVASGPAASQPVGRLPVAGAPGVAATDKPAQPGRDVAIRLPLSGPREAVGQSMLRAAQLVLEAPDAPRLISKDTGGTPEGAATAAREAIAAGAGLILGPLTSGETAAVAPIAKEARIAVLAFTNDAAQAQPGVWTLGITPVQQVRRLVDVAQGMGKTRFSALVPNSDFGRAMSDALLVIADQRGLPMPNVVQYGAGMAGINSAVRNVSGYSSRRGVIDSEIKAARSKLSAEGRREAAEISKRAVPPPNFDGLLLADAGDVLAEIASMMSYYDLDRSSVQVYGPALWSDPASQSGNFPGALFAAPDPSTRADFVQAYTAKFDAPPSPVADLAVDAAAIARLLANGPGYSIGELTRAEGYAGVDGPLALMADGQVRRGLAVFRVQRGGAQLAEPAPSNFGAPGF